MAKAVKPDELEALIGPEARETKVKAKAKAH